MFLFIVLIVLLRNNLVNVVNNFGKLLIGYDDSLELYYLKNEYNSLLDDYNKLVNFRNNIVISDDYTISNVYRNNYGFDKLIINGDSYKLNDEVLSDEGLIGIVSKVNDKYSEVTYIYDLNIPIRVNGSIGRIVGKDSSNNLIVKDVSGVSLNDLVYSVNNSYIGKVISVADEDLGSRVIVKTVDLSDIDYVIVKDC